MRRIGFAVVLAFGLFLVSPAAESQPKTLPLVAVLDPATAFAAIVKAEPKPSWCRMPKCSRYSRSE